MQNGELFLKFKLIHIQCITHTLILPYYRLEIQSESQKAYEDRYLFNGWNLMRTY